MKKVDMFSKKGYGSPTWRCYSYATCANLTKANAKYTNNKWRCKLMCSTWLDLAFTRFKYLTDFQENNMCNSCFVIISNNIQVKLLASGQPIAFLNKLISSLIKMIKWNAHVHMAIHKHGGRPWAQASWTPLNPALLLSISHWSSCSIPGVANQSETKSHRLCRNLA